MKKCFAKIFSMLLIITFICTLISPYVVYAQEESEVNKNDLVEAIVVAPTALADEGMVVGDGVRLRAEPNTTSTVLELMYWGEYVLIDTANSTMTFSHVQRVKTGTYGYVSSQYIVPIAHVK